MSPGIGEGVQRGYLRARYRSNHQTTAGRGLLRTGQPNPKERAGDRNRSRKSTCKGTNGPRTMVFPQLNSARFMGGRLPDQIPRGFCDVGSFGAARAKAHFCSLGDFPIFATFARARARTNYTHQNSSVAFAAGKLQPRRLVRHDRKSQLGIGRRAGWTSFLCRVSRYLHDFSGARFTDLQRGGVQIKNSLRVRSRCAKSRAHFQAPIMAKVPIPCDPLL